MYFKIATEQEVYDIGGTKPSDYIANRGITVGRVELFGCSIENSSECFVDLTNPNQLVPLELIKSQDSKYLKFTSNQDGSTVGYTITGTVNKDIYTSTDGINWTAWDGTSKTLNQGESFYVWNKVGSLSISDSNYLQFTMSGSIAASGDISSMINWAALANSCYSSMFNGCTSLVTAPELPATTLADSCYRSMFYGCTSLTTAPSLPATTLVNNCYRSIFQGCTSLVTAPELPATTLANLCYYGMFNGCTSLVTAPELPATTLVNNCYDLMFQGCTSLTTAPSLPATTLANYCYSYMFYGCTSLTTAPSLPATTLADYCYYGMFNGCTSLTTAPELPATTLADSCYRAMFKGCTSLVTAPELPATTLANYCYSYMFYGCTSLTTAPSLPATTLADYCYGSMFQDCTSLNHIKLSYTGSFNTSYFTEWVNGVGSSGNFYYNGSNTTRGVSAIPNGWTVRRF